MILIVDSEKIADNKLKQSFIELGLTSILVAKTAEQARKILTENDSDNGHNKITLIIISNEIEDANEFEFCRELKNTPSAQGAYIILLVSSNNNKKAIEKAKYSGASDFAVKPYHADGFQTHLIRYLKNRVVMLVEDDPLIRQMVRGILASYHVEILEIDDGVDAYNLINNMHPVRVVLMDIGLPNMNGIQLVGHIRNSEYWKKTPVVMLTASSDISDVKKCLTAGAKDYITKPFNISDFVKRLSRYLPDAS